MAGYLLKGQWDPEYPRKFYGQEYIRFLADLPSSGGTEVSGVGVYLPKELMSAEYEEIELPPGTKIMRLVPFTITVGDPSGLPRHPQLTYEDLDVEPVSVRAIPASGPAA